MLRNYDGSRDWAMTILFSLILLGFLLIFIIIILLLITLITTSNNERIEIITDCYDREYNLINEVTCTDEVILNCNKLESFMIETCFEEGDVLK